jgi:branched-subunit amino acid transport protein
VSATWWTIVGLAVTTAAVKAAGPVLLGGRELPSRFSGLVALMAPALLTALVVTSVLADGDRWQVGAKTVGVVVGGVVAWRGASVVTTLVVAVALTALLRLAGLP